MLTQGKQEFSVPPSTGLIVGYGNWRAIAAPGADAVLNRTNVDHDIDDPDGRYNQDDNNTEQNEIGDQPFPWGLLRLLRRGL